MKTSAKTHIARSKELKWTMERAAVRVVDALRRAAAESRR